MAVIARAKKVETNSALIKMHANSTAVITVEAMMNGIFKR
jgi:hypothetical protein